MENKILYTSIYKYLEESQIKNLKKEDICCINKIEFDTIEFVNNLGLRASLKGYKYIKESISVELLGDTDYNIKRNGTIIGTIAKENHTEKTNIERNMRYAIEDLNKMKDYRELNKILGVNAFSKYSIPSNLELVFCAAERIRTSNIEIKIRNYREEIKNQIKDKIKNQIL